MNGPRPFVSNRVLFVLFYKSVELSRNLATARVDGSQRKLLSPLNKVDVLVIDDWAMTPMSDAERRDCLETAERPAQTERKEE